MFTELTITLVLDRQIAFHKMIYEAEENDSAFCYGLDVGWIKNQKRNWGVMIVH